MRYALPDYSKSRVDAAGKALRTLGVQGISSDDLAVINNWRAAHSQPLVTFNMTLRSRSAKVDPDALVAQRLKRLTSIEAKLRDRPNMRFTQMQDIGGVRAVVSGVANVLALADQYRESRMQHKLASEDDYINAPKADGYRGVHLIYRYISEYERSSVYDGLFVELQIRSRMQHAWATTVETVSTLTGQALKSTLNIRRGEERWRRFLALMSGVIASWEKSAPVPEVPTDSLALIGEVKALARELRVAEILTGWQEAIKRLPTKNVEGAQVFILYIDPATKIAQAVGYRESEVAEEAYVQMERELEAKGGQAVLVSVDRVNRLRTAYPNYFLDTRYFVSLLHQALEK